MVGWLSFASVDVNMRVKVRSGNISRPEGKQESVNDRIWLGKMREGRHKKCHRLVERRGFLKVQKNLVDKYTSGARSRFYLL